MSGGYDNPPMIAGGAINPAVFVTLSTGADQTLVQSANGDMPFGIAQDSSELAPAFSQSAAAAAASGDQIPYYSDGQTCLLSITATTAANDLLMPDAAGNGTGITHTGSHWYGAVALQAGVSGDKIKVKIRIGYN